MFNRCDRWDIRLWSAPYNPGAPWHRDHLDNGVLKRYGLFKVLYLRLSILVFEDSGSTGHLVRTGFQTDEGLRFTGLRRFSHVGILRTGGLRQRIVDLIHVVEGLRHYHSDLTVVLTLHVVLTK